MPVGTIIPSYNVDDGFVMGPVRGALIGVTTPNVQNSTLTARAEDRQLS